jgi:SAM-dependent methyltransferase
MHLPTPDPWREDLLWQARRGMELGRAQCICPGRYHWLYGAMRAAGMVSSLKSEEPQLASLLAPLLRRGIRIMIGGSADPGLFCALGRISAACGADITVIDRCGAPLELIREFALERGLRCRTLHSDLMALDGREQWDLVFLHYTLNFIEPRLRGTFFAALASALAPGGVLVSAAMTGDAISCEQQSGLAAAFAARSRQALARTALADDAKRSDFEESLEIYAADTTAMRLIWPSADETRAAMRFAGLEIRSEHTITRDWSLFGRSETERRLDSSTILVAEREARAR